MLVDVLLVLNQLVLKPLLQVDALAARSAAGGLNRQISAALLELTTEKPFLDGCAPSGLHSAPLSSIVQNQIGTTLSLL